MGKIKIAYCAGHGMNTPGKRTPNDEREWSFNNKVVLAFENEIKKYKGVQLLRTDDPTGKIDIPLVTRTNRANSWGANIYISFHHNAFQGKWGTHTGVETLYSNNSSQGKKLAELVQAAIVKAYGLRSRGLKTNNLHITRETEMPAILVEGGFMDSTIDIKKLKDDNVLKNVGVEIARAVAEYGNLQLEEKTTSSATVNNGWKGLEGGKWSFYKDGKKQIGWVCVNDKWYFLNNDGIMETGWLKDDNKWYYLSDNGSMYKGWLSDKGKWYRLNNSGVMLTSFHQIESDWYFFAANGVMASDTELKIDKDGKIAPFKGV